MHVLQPMIALTDRCSWKCLSASLSMSLCISGMAPSHAPDMHGNAAPAVSQDWSGMQPMRGRMKAASAERQDPCAGRGKDVVPWHAFCAAVWPIGRGMKPRGQSPAVSRRACLEWLLHPHCLPWHGEMYWIALSCMHRGKWGSISTAAADASR